MLPSPDVLVPHGCHPLGSSSPSTADQKSVNVVDLHLLRRQNLGALVPGCIHRSSTPRHSRGRGWGQVMQGHDRLLQGFVLLSYLSDADAQRICSASCANMNFAFADEKSFSL